MRVPGIEPRYAGCQAGASPYPGILLVLSKLIQEDGTESLPTLYPVSKCLRTGRKGLTRCWGFAQNSFPAEGLRTAGPDSGLLGLQ